MAQDTPLWTRETLAGEWGGTRRRLSERGIDVDLTYTGEVFGSLEGGQARGATYEDLFR